MEIQRPHLLLTVENISNYLREGGIDVPLDGVRISPVHRRNRNYLVEWVTGGVFVKQDIEVPTSWFVKIATVVEHISQCSPQISPKLLFADEGCRVEVYDLVPSAINGSECFYGASTIQRLALIDQMIERLHQTHCILTDRSLPALDVLPWALSVLQPPVSSLSYISQGSLQLLHAAQSDRNIVLGINHLTERWKPKELVHGDVRFENFLISDQECFVIDWEMVQRGNTLSDYAGLASSLLSHWIAGMSMERDGSNLIVPDWDCRLCLRHLIACINSYEIDLDLNQFWNGVAARLVQYAFEGCEGLVGIPLKSIHMLQLASNIFSDPSRAQQKLT